MADKTANASKDAQRRREEREFDRAAREFARKVGPVGPEEFHVTLDHGDDPMAQALSQAARELRRRKIN